MGGESEREIWSGDFIAHSSLWGSDHTDNNGAIIEEMIDRRDLVCINNGKESRLDISRNKMLCIDLTLVSANMANICEWKIFNDNIGNDQFPIICTINTDKCTQESAPIYRWCFQKAQWDKFREPCRKSVSNSEMTDNVDESTNEVTTIITEAEERRRQFCFSIGRQKETWDMYGI